MTKLNGIAAFAQRKFDAANLSSTKLGYGDVRESGFRSQES
ncbi:MAG: hypothetical protein QNJ37_10175 [Crocosphaera sp.]|nr:hypothetical protein [Crocosphaera sp.]